MAITKAIRKPKAILTDSARETERAITMDLKTEIRTGLKKEKVKQMETGTDLSMVIATEKSMDLQTY
jgi:hypothetical protein